MTQTAEVTQEKEMTVVIRPEFKNICQKDACRAAVFNHILYWIAYKRKQGEACWYATGQQIYKQLCETWGISVIRRSINALIATGMIGQTHNPKWGADRTKYFFFGQDQAKSFFTACTQEKICPWCISHLPPIVSDLLTTHLLILSNANDESVKCICQNHQMELLKTANGSDRSNKAITKGSTKGSTKGTSKILSREAIEESEDSLVASANAESDGGASFLSSLSQFEEKLQEVQNGQAPLYTSCIPDRREGEPVKPAGDSEKPAVTSAVHDTTPLQEIPDEKPLFPAAQPPHNDKTHGKGNRKISVLSVPKVPPRVIREAIDAIRGYSLDQEGPIKHQGVILKEWCQKHTLEDFQHVIEHLTKGRCSNEKHQWWREKNHMKTFFNAAKLAELTPDILSELGHIPKPEALPEVAPVEEPKIVGWTPVRQIYPPKGVTVTYG